MSQLLQYSMYEEQPTKNIKRNKTYKRRNQPSKKVKNFLEAMETNDGPSDFEDTPGTYTEPPRYEPLQKKKQGQKPEEDNTDNPIESFTQLPPLDSPYSASNREYYSQYVPYFTNAVNNKRVDASQEELMKKLNYMIHLLEEQQDEKTSNIAEELILYLFLGIFVIFVVDSFARAGKYTR